MQNLAADLLEIQLEAEVDRNAALTLAVRGVPVVVDGRKQTLSCGDAQAPLPPGGKVMLQILVDRGSVEVFGNHGRVAISRGVIPAEGARGYTVSAKEPQPG